MDQLIKEECPLKELPFETVEGGSETMTGSGGQRTLSNLTLSNLERRLLRLQHLGLHKPQISEISFPTGVCPELQYLAIRDCQDLVEVGTLPNALRGLHSIDCPKLRKIERLSGFAKCLLHLQHFELHNTAISEVSFPTDVCPNLQHLNIKDCEGLIEVRTLPNALIILELDNCPKLKLMSIADLAQVMQLREIRVHLCNGLEELLGVGHMKSLEVLQASGCAKLKSILGLDQLTQLIILDVPFNLC